MNRANDTFSVNDLTKIRKLVITIVNVLEQSLDEFSKNNKISDDNVEFINFLFGKKCDIVSILTKLTNVLIKLIPLEIKITAVDSDNEKCSDEDIEILRRYIKKCNFWFNKDRQTSLDDDQE